MLIEVRRCTGHCCRAFLLPLDPEGLRAARERARKVLIDGVESDGPIYEDIDTIVDMVIYLGEFHANPIEIVNEIVDETAPVQAGHFYTCKHFIDNNCSIYERRPSMCRDYPYGGKCEYAECTREVMCLGEFCANPTKTGVSDE